MKGSLTNILSLVRLLMLNISGVTDSLTDITIPFFPMPGDPRPQTYLDLDFFVGEKPRQGYYCSKINIILLSLTKNDQQLTITESTVLPKTNYQNK